MRKLHLHFVRGLFVLALGIGLLSSAGAAERILKLDALNKAVSGEDVRIEIHVGTDAGADEHIGFLHVEGSVDAGKTWVHLSYLSDLKTMHHNVYTLKAGAAGSIIQIRARVAFRGGAAGDVDYAGNAIRWDDTWAKWSEPPTRMLVISVD